jgi:hypothetical protein
MLTRISINQEGNQDWQLKSPEHDMHDIDMPQNNQRKKEFKSGQLYRNLEIIRYKI